MLSNEGWAQWVRVRSRNGLSRYSWFNQVQIAAQRLDASYVCGLGDWLRLGYELADQELRHPIWILAPFTAKRTETVEEEITGGTEIERRYRYFRAVKVYDHAQVRPIDGAQSVDLRPPGRPLSGNSHAHLLPALCALAQSLGYPVTAHDLDANGAQGWCDPADRVIVVNRQRPANARVRILVHEIAHAHPAGKLDYQHFTRQQAEVLVDTVIFWREASRRGLGAGRSVGDRRYRRALVCELVQVQWWTRVLLVEEEASRLSRRCLRNSRQALCRSS